jgi:hypothetical protein
LTIEYGLNDNLKARIVDGKGSNELHNTNEGIAFRSQEELYKFYKSAIK